jgi:hypothetical protein
LNLKRDLLVSKFAFSRSNVCRYARGDEYGEEGGGFDDYGADVDYNEN